ncbi:hypothetical protein O181_055827 [Austropuccinia psidii MF-1]|uniref:Uncharacterized protein n=1 Tax=Austropuccinia psidii MF-1 TaxID=1389203 RepID=A0A9Q3E9N3_9BASI|nr:hypothetical protein [Austropuccinia psidii MF-1]
MVWPIGPNLVSGWNCCNTNRRGSFFVVVTEGTEGVLALVGASQSTGGPTIAQYNQTVSHQYEPSVLDIMQQMTQIMTNLQAASSSEASRPQACKTPSMKAPECFDGAKPFKVRSFIQSCKLIFHNDLENVS